jgi:hypothetical protein
VVDGVKVTFRIRDMKGMEMPKGNERNPPSHDRVWPTRQIGRDDNRRRGEGQSGSARTNRSRPRTSWEWRGISAPTSPCRNRENTG